ncbi:hypothetical protein [Komagataeibacter melaceti]|uniref:hypothetical protein n=1 Tax=Komagataeibacter melaceti TaxID=2766577 RepID=UPI00131416BE|nr:hypothetical protein [Komagataeibacter melaceti]
MPFSTPLSTPLPASGKWMPMQRASRTAPAAPLRQTWAARAWWQRLACMAMPCAALWGLIAWAVSQP